MLAELYWKFDVLIAGKATWLSIDVVFVVCLRDFTETFVDRSLGLLLFSVAAFPAQLSPSF